MKSFNEHRIEEAMKRMTLYGAMVSFDYDRAYKKTESVILRDLKILQRANKVYSGDEPLKLQHIEFQILGTDGVVKPKPEWEKLVIVKDQISIYEILRGNNQYTKAAIRPVKAIIFAAKD